MKRIQMKTKSAVISNSHLELSAGGLLSALQFVVPFSEVKTTIPILRTVLLSAKDGILALSATDLEMAGVAELTVAQGEELDAAVNARNLLGFLNLLDPGLDVALSIRDSMLRIQQKDSVALLPLASVESFPNLPLAPSESIVLPNISQIARRILISISDEESRFVVSAALIELNPDGSRMISTDGHRLSIVDLGVSAMTYRALIPLGVLKRLANAAVDPVAFSWNDSHVFFALPGGRRMLARKLTGNFPDHRRITSEREHSCPIPNGFEAALTRAIHFSDPMTRMVQFCFGDYESVLTVRGQSGAGEIANEIKCSWPGKPLTIGVNGRYVAQFLELTRDERIEFAATNDREQMHFKAAGWSYIVMPFRI